jgi:O-acetyl-ADP-ribose deacetylase (regulator of RNase III)
MLDFTSVPAAAVMAPAIVGCAAASPAWFAMNNSAQVLPIDRYRALVALDEPFAPARAALPSEYSSLVRTALAHLEQDSAAGKRREALGGASVPDDARLRLRALLTVRAPEPLPKLVQDAIDGVLQIELDARSVVDVGTLPRFSLPRSGAGPFCALWQGDITMLKADAIVNAANSELLGCFRPFHACIDNAIHSAAGPRLREDCARIMRAQGALEPTGTTKATRAYNLPSRFVLHTVGPIVSGSLAATHEEELARAYRACLDTAVGIGGVRSVAFCGISTGVFGFPREPAARIALRTVGAWLAEHPSALDLVVFNVFAGEDGSAYLQALRSEGVR